MDEVDPARYTEFGEHRADLIRGGACRRAAALGDLRLRSTLDQHPSHLLFGLRQLVREMKVGAREAAELQLFPLVNVNCEAGPDSHIEGQTAVKGNARHEHEERELSGAAVEAETPDATPSSERHRSASEPNVDGNGLLLMSEHQT